MIDGKKVNEAAEKFARTSVSVYRALVGQAAGTQASGRDGEMRRRANRALARGLRSDPGSRVTGRTKAISSQKRGEKKSEGRGVVSPGPLFARGRLAEESPGRLVGQVVGLGDRLRDQAAVQGRETFEEGGIGGGGALHTLVGYLYQVRERHAGKRQG